MTDRDTVNAAEAMVGAIYRLPQAEFLGETDQPRDGKAEHCYYFHIGTAPKDMRAVVLYGDVEPNVVQLHLVWRNYSADARKPLLGSLDLRVSTLGSQSAIADATTQAVVRVLEVYKDVLTETGVAGDISKLAPNRPEASE